MTINKLVPNFDHHWLAIYLVTPFKVGCDLQLYALKTLEI